MANMTINPYRFGGQLGYRRDGTNRNYVRARHLDTIKARWISRDPIPLAEVGANFYWYVKNNPITLVDPRGLEPTPPSKPTCSCNNCAGDIVAAYYFSPQHYCNHAYMHCTSCCILARSFGSKCALDNQNWQNHVDFTKWFTKGTAQGRLNFCHEGIRRATESALSCSDACLQPPYGWPTCPPDCFKNHWADCPKFLKRPTPIKTPNTCSKS